MNLKYQIFVSSTYEGLKDERKPVLAGGKRPDSPPPYLVDSPAAQALSPNREAFLPGDRIVAVTDPDDPSGRATPLTPKPPYDPEAARGGEA